MEKKHRKPAWWILYVLLLIMIGALLLESQDGLPAWANEVAAVLIVLLFFGAVWLWLHVNTPALLDEEVSKIDPEEFHIEFYPPPKPPDESRDEEKDRLLYLSFPRHRLN